MADRTWDALRSTIVEFYRGLPGPVQHVWRTMQGCVPLRLRFSRRFYRQLHWLEASQWWSADQLRAYQCDRLQALVRHAAQTVPFYIDTFREQGLRPEDIRTPKDLEALPVIDKALVMEAPARFRSSRFPDSQVIFTHTSGSTGRVIRVALDPAIEFMYGGPFQWRYHGWAGMRPGDRVAMLRTTRAEFTAEQPVQYHPGRRELQISSIHLNEQTLPRIIHALRRRPCHFWNAYPSSILRLADLLDSTGLTLPHRPRAILTLGERLTDAIRDRVESVLGAPIFDWYAMEERAVLAHQCEQRDGQHLISEFGIAELLPDPAGDGPARRIVATGLVNFAMPLLRYDTGDLAEPVEGACACGRAYPRVRILGGRNRLFLTGHSGEDLPLDHQILRGIWQSVRQFQFVQHGPGLCVLRIEPGAGFDDSVQRRLQLNIDRFYGGKLEVRIETTDRIERTHSGKAILRVDAQAGGSPSAPASR